MSALLKVLLLLSCTFLGLICGTLYLYSSYSPQFAAELHYSATDSSRIALCGTIGVAVAGPFVGQLVDLRGYTLSLLLGGACVILGYYGMKVQYESKFSSVALSSTMVFMIGCGSTFMNSACLKCCAVSFPSIRGVATLLPLALYGLSALFYSVIATMFFPGDTSKFLGFLSYSSLAIFMVCAPCVMLYDRQNRRSRSRTTTAMGADFELTTMPTTLHKPLLVTDQYPAEIGGMALLSSRSFWIIFFITGALASLGQMYIYLVGYIVKSVISFDFTAPLTGSAEVDLAISIQQSQLLQVGLLSVANCVGRIASGILGDIMSQLFHKPRSLLLFLPCIGMLVTQVMAFTITEHTNLSVLSLSIGFFYGFTFCIMPLIVGDVFGMENYSLNWGFVGMAPILPSFYFTDLFGKTYDRNSIMLDSGVKTCELGKECYSSVFRVTVWVTVFATMAVFLLLRKRKVVSIDKIIK